MSLRTKHTGRWIMTPVALALSQVIMGDDSQAMAQQAVDTAGLETFVITARRVAENLQEVPIAVSAFGMSQIENAVISSMEDVARLTPGFSFERTTGGLVQPAMRGQAQYRITNPVQNVATFLNGVYLQRSYQVDTDLLGLDRVEIIKGPQSALFGRNAFAGAISYNTRKPSLEQADLGADITVGNYDLREYKGYLSFPFSRVAAMSLAVSSSEADGTWPNSSQTAGNVTGPGVRTKGNVNGWDKQGALLQFRVKPNTDLDINAFWNHRNIFIESPAINQMSSIGLVSAYNTMNCRPFDTAAAQASKGVNSLYCGAIPSKLDKGAGEPRVDYVVADPRAYSQKSRTDVMGLNADLDLSQTTSLAMTLGHTEANNSNYGTLSRDPTRGIGVASPFNGLVLLESRGNGSIKSDSFELRATYDQQKWRAMAGTYMSKVDDFEYGATYIAPPNSGADLSLALYPTGNVFPPGFSATQRKEHIKGIFGSIGAEVLPGLRLTIEGRQTTERIEQQAATYPAQVLFGNQLSREFKYFTPRYTADYKLNDSAMIFASAAKGVKSGGFNPSAVVADDRVYTPESNWTYELGVKTTTPDGKLMFNGSVYHVDWTNMQINRPLTGGALGSPTVIGNVSGADVDGIEGALRWKPSRPLTIDATYSYTKARYNSGAQDPTLARALCQAPISASCATVADIGGHTVPRAPGTQASVGVNWKTPIPAVMGVPLQLNTHADVSYQGKSYVDNTNSSWTPPRTLVNASVGVEGKDWSLKFWARNLFDKEYVSFAFATFGASGSGSGVTYGPLLGDRRTVGLTLSFYR